MKKLLTTMLLFALVLQPGLVSAQSRTSSKATYDQEIFLPDWLMDLYDNNAQPNKQLDIAFEEMQYILENYKLYNYPYQKRKDLGYEATTLEEFLATYKSAGEELLYDVSDNISVAFYQFKDLNPSDTLPIEEWAELLVYFENDVLTSVSIGTLTFFVNEEAATSSQTYRQLETSADFANIEGQVYGFGLMYLEDEPVFSVFTPYVNRKSDQRGGFSVVYKDKVEYQYNEDINVVLDNGPNYYYLPTFIDFMDN